MPFVYKPSLWGFAASAIFIGMMLIELQSEEWVHALMWALLSLSFLLKYLPKFMIFSIQGTIAALMALVAGGTMFIMYASDRISTTGFDF